MITPQGAVAFQFDVQGTVADEQVTAWHADGMVFTPVDPAPATARPVEDPEVRPGAILSSGHFVRVDLARLDELMRMIGDLVISRARLERRGGARRAPSAPRSHWRAVQENSRDDRTAAARSARRRDARPAGAGRRDLPPHAVRGARPGARQRQARSALELRGQDTEIDKFLIERMMDPILHLVRNAVSHGIETAGERVAAGKPRRGARLTLERGQRRRDRRSLEIADDGRGIDAEAVAAARAGDAGCPCPTEPLDDATLLDLICAPGFSTRDETDRASGRGVGMAVVKTTRRRSWAGRMTLETAPGRRHPLRHRAAADAGDHRRDASRASAIARSRCRSRRCAKWSEIDPAAIRALRERRDRAAFRGGRLPIVRLAACSASRAAARDALARLGRRRAGRRRSASLVDRIIGQREIVVRAIGRPADSRRRDRRAPPTSATGASC